jgi:hypothetical protein
LVIIGNFAAICKAMRETGILADFIAIGGAEGGTGAARGGLSAHAGNFRPIGQKSYIKKKIEQSDRSLYKSSVSILLLTSSPLLPSRVVITPDLVFEFCANQRLGTCPGPP